MTSKPSWSCSSAKRVGGGIAHWSERMGKRGPGDNRLFDAVNAHIWQSRASCERCRNGRFPGCRESADHDEH